LWDVDTLDTISESEVAHPEQLEAKLNPAADKRNKQPKQLIPVGLARPSLVRGESILPAQLAIFLSSVPATLNLTPVKEVRV
jgi:hypothetical protein